MVHSGVVLGPGKFRKVSLSKAGLAQNFQKSARLYEADKPHAKTSFSGKQLQEAMPFEEGKIFPSCEGATIIDPNMGLRWGLT